MNENSVITRINGVMNNKYVENLLVRNVDAMVEDVFVADYILDDIMEEGFLEEYTDGEYELVIVDYDYDKTFIGLNSFPSDTSKYLFFSEDGEAFVSSYLPSMDLDEGTYYAGDEIIQVGKVEGFSSKSKWAGNSLYEVVNCKTLTLSKATMKRIIEKCSGDK